MQIIRNAGTVITSGGYNALTIPRASIPTRVGVQYSGRWLGGLGADSSSPESMWPVYALAIGLAYLAIR